MICSHNPIEMLKINKIAQSHGIFLYALIPQCTVMNVHKELYSRCAAIFGLVSVQGQKCRVCLVGDFCSRF